MKRLGQLSAVFLIITLLFSMGSIPVSAETKTVDGISVSFETDKQAYKDDETVIGKFEIFNASINDIQNIDAKMIMPKGYAVNEGSVMSYNYDVIGAGQNVGGEITCVPNPKEHNYTGLFWTSGRITILIGSIVGVVALIFIIGMFVFYANMKDKPSADKTATSLLLTFAIGISMIVCTTGSVSAEEDATSDRNGNAIVLSESVKCESLYIQIQFRVSFKTSGTPIEYRTTTVESPQEDTTVYEKTVSTLMNEYGQGDVVEDKSVSNTNRYCIDGLGLVKLIDFDKDGTDELLCVCGKSKNDTYTAEIKIYHQKGKTVETVYEDTCIYKGKDTTYYTEYIAEDKEVLLHTKTSHINTVNDEWSRLSNGKFSVARTLHSQMESDSVWIYQVDGKNVTPQEFDTKTGDFERRKVSFAMNNQQDPDNLYAILQSSKSTINLAAPSVTYSFSEKFLSAPTEPPTEKPTPKPTQPPVQRPSQSATQPANNNNNNSNGRVTVIPPQGGGNSITIIPPQGGNRYPVYGGGYQKRYYSYPYNYSYGYSYDYPYGDYYYDDYYECPNNNNPSCTPQP